MALAKDLFSLGVWLVYNFGKSVQNKFVYTLFIKTQLLYCIDSLVEFIMKRLW